MEKREPDAPAAIATLERHLATVPLGDVPALLGDLERLRAALTARMLREAVAPPPPSPTTSVDDLRHLTPAQVAELLNLKEPYVHELCRSRKLPATKSGKYWIIPVAGLREWLMYRGGDIDRSAEPRLRSVSPLGDSGAGPRRSAREVR